MISQMMVSNAVLPTYLGSERIHLSIISDSGDDFYANVLSPSPAPKLKPGEPMKAPSCKRTLKKLKLKVKTEDTIRDSPSVKQNPDASLSSLLGSLHACFNQDSNVDTIQDSLERSFVPEEVERNLVLVLDTEEWLSSAKGKLTESVNQYFTC